MSPGALNSPISEGARPRVPWLERFGREWNSERLPDLTPQSLLPVPWGTTRSTSSPRADSGGKIRVDFKVHVWTRGPVSIKSQPLRGLGKRDPRDAQTPACLLSSGRSSCSRASLKLQLRPARPAYPRFFPTAGPEQLHRASQSHEPARSAQLSASPYRIANPSSITTIRHHVQRGAGLQAAAPVET